MKRQQPAHFLRKRLKDRNGMEISERRQVGDAEAVVNAPPKERSEKEDDDRQL